MRTRRFEGRLFAEGGCLFMVLAVNESEGTARVSCRMDGRHVVLDMLLTEVAKRVSASSGLQLDNLNSPDAKRRLIARDDGWHFSTREGVMGPYPTEQEAARELGRYVLCMQTDPTPAARAAAPTARTPHRRSSDRSKSALHATG